MKQSHEAIPWRVHELASDFKLEDVWAIPLGDARQAPFEDFLPVFWKASEGLLRLKLFRLRMWLGQKLRWDRDADPLPIPGCEELSVADRLAPEERKEHASPLEVSGAELKTIYVLENDALYEVSNETVHALIHLSWPDGSPQRATLAIYTKSRGMLTDAYMLAIRPFRHGWVYPHWIGLICSEWNG